MAGASDIIGGSRRCLHGRSPPSATADNAMGEKDMTPTRETPVLTEALLLAMLRAANLG